MKFEPENQIILSSIKIHPSVDELKLLNDMHPPLPQNCVGWYDEKLENGVIV